MARAADSDARRRRSTYAKTVSTKIQAMVWVVAAALTVHYTKFVEVCTQDPRVDRIYFNISLATFAASSTLILYLALYLPYVRGIDTDWMEYCPNIIYTATAFGVISGLTFMFALWPVWGLLTPAVQFLVFVGALMFSHFIPAC